MLKARDPVGNASKSRRPNRCGNLRTTLAFQNPHFARGTI